MNGNMWRPNARVSTAVVILKREGEPLLNFLLHRTSQTAQVSGRAEAEEKPVSIWFELLRLIAIRRERESSSWRACASFIQLFIYLDWLDLWHSNCLGGGWSNRSLLLSDLHPAAGMKLGKGSEAKREAVLFSVWLKWKSRRSKVAAHVLTQRLWSWVWAGSQKAERTPTRHLHSFRWALIMPGLESRPLRLPVVNPQMLQAPIYNQNNYIRTLLLHFSVCRRQRA